MASNALIIFIKNPVKGQVKTRLAAGVGDEQALRIYRALLAHTRQVALASHATQRLLFYARHIDRDDSWQATDFQKFRQADGDLGRRMEDAFTTALKSHEKAVIIGSDCAGLTPEIVNRALNLLDETDAVIGPALDGGYYLLGLKQVVPAIFREMEWSTATVFEETVQRLQQTGYRYQLVDALADIDYASDWETYGWELD